MDSLAYSVMLEINANTSGIDKTIEKSLKSTRDYHKQFEDISKRQLKTYDRITDSHRATNKVLKEQVTIWDSIWNAAAKTLTFILTLPLTVGKYVLNAITSIVNGMSKVFMLGINAIDAYISDAEKAFDKLSEDYRFANIQAAGGVDILHDSMADLMRVTGANFEKSKEIVMGLAKAGFSAKKMGTEFGTLSKTMWGFERITGVSIDTSAGLAKGLMGIGFSAKDSGNMIKMFAEYQHMAMLSTEELTSVMNALKEEMFQIEFVFGKGTVQKYSKAMMELAGAAKMAGVPIEKAVGLMRDLNNEPMKFIVALGGDALYKSADENMESLIGRVDQIKSSLENMPPFLKPQMLKELYGLDAAQLKVLETMSEFRKQNPAIAEFQSLLMEANGALSTQYDIIKNKIMAVFNRVAAIFVKYYKQYIPIFEKVGEAVANLFDAIFDTINKVFDDKLIDKWGGGFMSWLGDISDELVVLIDQATAWVDSLASEENLKLIHTYLEEVNAIIEQEIIPAFREIYRVFADEILPSIVDFSVALAVFVVDAAVVLYEVLKLIFNYVDEWVDSGGPKRLVDQLLYIGEILLWIGGAVLAAKVLSAVVAIVKAVIFLSKAVIFLSKTVIGLLKIATAIGVKLVTWGAALLGINPIFLAIAAVVGSIAYLAYKAWKYWSDSAAIEEARKATERLEAARRKANEELAKNPRVYEDAIKDTQDYINSQYNLGKTTKEVNDELMKRKKQYSEVSKWQWTEDNALSKAAFEERRQNALNNMKAIDEAMKKGHKATKTPVAAETQAATAAGAEVKSGADKIKGSVQELKDATAKLGKGKEGIGGALEKLRAGGAKLANRTNELLEGIKVDTALSAKIQKDRKEQLERDKIQKITEEKAGTLTPEEYQAMLTVRAIGQKAGDTVITREKAIQNRLDEMAKRAQWAGKEFNREQAEAKLIRNMEIIKDRDLKTAAGLAIAFKEQAKNSKKEYDENKEISKIISRAGNQITVDDVKAHMEAMKAQSEAQKTATNEAVKAQADAEKAATEQKEKAQKPASKSPTSEASAGAVHESTKSLPQQPVNVVIDEQTLSKMAADPEFMKKQIAFLAQIAENTKASRSHRRQGYSDSVQNSNRW